MSYRLSAPHCGSSVCGCTYPATTRPGCARWAPAGPTVRATSVPGRRPPQRSGLHRRRAAGLDLAGYDTGRAHPRLHGRDLRETPGPPHTRRTGPIDAGPPGDATVRFESTGCALRSWAAGPGVAIFPSRKSPTPAENRQGHGRVADHRMTPCAGVNRPRRVIRPSPPVRHLRFRSGNTYLNVQQTRIDGDHGRDRHVGAAMERKLVVGMPWWRVRRPQAAQQSMRLVHQQMRVRP